MRLGTNLVLRVFVLVIVFAAFLFIPAGTMRFWQGWTFLAILFIPGIPAFLYLLKHDPELIERRLQTKEKATEQKLLIRLLRPFFVAAYLIPGLDYRIGWSRALLGAVPLWLMLASQGFALVGVLLVMWVLMVNSYASRTIQVEAGQEVISTGPYSLVRHPMYLGSALMWMSIPLALGSYVAWPAFAVLVPFYVFRLLSEEKVLRQELPGYPEYCVRTRHRLVPFVW
jgi:protein-S-isoprenylcysteine O-methyltransferase Ste14